MLYLGYDVKTCLWETFGDAVLNPGAAIASSRWMSRQLSVIQVKTELRICDLTETRVRSLLKVDLSALMHTNLDYPQAWGLALMNHPDMIDGIHYNSRFTNRRCTVLFGRENIRSVCRAMMIENLSDLEQGGSFLEENEIALV